ncbi:MAG: MarR family transcriptional regulator [Ignavibacteria bacterium]|nr:MarR family transcriptional regulator [Ignavibacteria bacterium]
MLDKSGIDITPDQWLVLDLIIRSKGYTQREIAQKLGKDTAAVNRMLALLEKKGYISRITAEGKTAKPVATESGTIVFNAATVIIYSASEAAMKGIKPKRTAKLEKTLRDITKNLKH